MKKTVGYKLLGLMPKKGGQTKAVSVKHVRKPLDEHVGPPATNQNARIMIIMWYLS